MNPKITIIIPTYNREVLLRRALNSVPLSKDYQIIVIDDGKIVGIGNHAELMKNCEAYEEIYLSQMDKEVVS